LLVAAGCGESHACTSATRRLSPLGRVAAEADVVINLPRGVPAIGAIRAYHPDLVVIVPDVRRDPLLVLPACCGPRPRSWHRVGCRVAYGAALALVMATPPLATLPPGPDRELANQVADAVIWPCRPPPDILGLQPRHPVPTCRSRHPLSLNAPCRDAPVWRTVMPHCRPPPNPLCLSARTPPPIRAY